MVSAPLLAIEGVVKEYRSAVETVRVLHGVGFAVAEGETVAVTGPSGSGKSTLLGLMAGLERPDAGRVLHRGRDLGTLDDDGLAAWRGRSVGFVFQNFRLVGWLSALENVMLPLELQGRPAAEARGRAEAFLAELGLEARAQHCPHQLSGGEQQRVAIARAYAHAPEFILADEPTGNLDRDTAARVIEVLLRVNAAHGAALVVVTHDPAVAGRMGRVLALQDGRVG